MTPRTYGGARHANKLVARQRPVPMVVRTWALCDDVQYLWWCELGWCVTSSSTYGGTNNASRTLRMNQDKYAAYWVGLLSERQGIDPSSKSMWDWT